MELLLKKLDALVLKLDKSGGKGSQAAKDIKAQLNDIKKGNLKGLSSVVESLEEKAENSQGASDLSASVASFDVILSGPLEQFKASSKTIGGDVATLGDLVGTAFDMQKSFLQTVSDSKQPKPNDLQKLLKPTSEMIGEIQQLRESNRRSEMFNHLSAISESIPALGWVAVSPAPAPYVKEMKDAGQFYTNRVLKDWKEKDNTHAVWVRSWVETLAQLQAFVKEFHTTGLVWNPKGGEADLSAIPTKPVPKPRVVAKVTASPAKSSVTPRASKPANQTQKPPSLHQDGKKWIVEYFKGDQNINIDQVEMNQSVYIFKCEASAIKVSGKCNNIIMDSCKKTAVVFDNVVSSCEFMNCSGVQMQVLGTVPTIMVDKTDGCQMFLSKEAIGVEIVSAKSSEMNVMVPQGEDFVEMAVSEQFKTVIEGSRIKTSPTESV
eukprot:GFUD01038106.1.p1 GENE.GFUD01038106.1~~GFUD01038106.1.p1  ORF type:complete len:435 (+),score=126.72 GFUD01038106.1:87-1391(+)